MKIEELKKFDEMQKYIDKVDLLDNILEREGFEYEKRVGNNNLQNITYCSRGSNIVTSFVVSSQIDGLVLPVILDKDVYDEFFSDGSLISVKTGGGDDKRLIPVKGGKVYVNTQLHRAALNLQKGCGIQVDHCTHYTGCALREELRPCTNRENAMNKPMRSVLLGNNSFKTKATLTNDEVNKFKDMGFTYSKKGYLVSPEYNTEKEMYNAIQMIETMLFGEFRYNPLLDFSETWYALILWKMLSLPEEDIMAYQRDYIIHNKPDVAKYYGIA